MTDSIEQVIDDLINHRETVMGAIFRIRSIKLESNHKQQEADKC